MPLAAWHNYADRWPNTRFLQPLAIRRPLAPYLIIHGEKIEGGTHGVSMCTVGIVPPASRLNPPLPSANAARLAPPSTSFATAATASLICHCHRP